MMFFAYLIWSVKEFSHDLYEGIYGHVSGRVLVRIIAEGGELGSAQQAPRLLLHHLQSCGPLPRSVCRTAPATPKI